MSFIDLADVSEWQGTVDWAAYAKGGYQAASARLSYGVGHIDLQAQANLAGMRANLRFRNWYHYLTAADDPLAQAELFCQILGQLEAGEAITVDSEEGSGDQELRAATFLSHCNQLLAVPASDDIEYSGLFFVASHGGWVPGVTRWVAAFQTDPPAQDQALWQRTDSQTFPGIAKACDGSRFYGTLEQLLAIINPPPPPAPGPLPAPQEDDDMALNFVAHTPNGEYLVSLDGKNSSVSSIHAGSTGSAMTGQQTATDLGLPYIGVDAATLQDIQNGGTPASSIR